MSEIAGRVENHVGLWSRVAGHRRAVEEELRRVSFADVVRAHHAWGGGSDETAAARAYGEALVRFERLEGRLESAYWCTHAAGGAAVTRRNRVLRFHRATLGHPDRRVTALLNECDELGVRISEVLRGTGQRIGIGLVLRTSANLLALSDDDNATTETVRHETGNLADAHAYYRRAARRQAQLVFVGGMLLGVVALMAIVLAILAILHVAADVRWIPHTTRGGSLASDVSLSTLYLCAIAGALGAVVSTASRIDENTFAVDYELGRFTIAALGAIRPLLGAVFGTALYAALVSGLLDLFAVPKDDVTQQLYFFLVVAFVAGFSERWAKGVLIGLGTKQAPAPSSGARRPA
jgi:hypothetical protein